MKPLLFATALALFFCSCTSDQPEPRSDFPLKEYVYTQDDAFRYEVIETIKGNSWTEYRIKMVSGSWLTSEEVDHPEWWHWLTMVVPDEVVETESMMFIGGGWRGDTLPVPANDAFIRAALATGSIISHISNIPFQPIDFKGDQKDGRYEDDLIAYGWRLFLESGAYHNWRNTEDMKMFQDSAVRLLWKRSVRWVMFLLQVDMSAYQMKMRILIFLSDFQN